MTGNIVDFEKQMVRLMVCPDEQKKILASWSESNVAVTWFGQAQNKQLIHKTWYVPTKDFLDSPAQATVFNNPNEYVIERIKCF
jgi:hypothetical protein